MCARAGGEPIGGQYIGLEKDGKIIAVCGYDNFNGASIQMHIAGEGKRWLNREFLWYCFHYPFNELKVNLVVGLVPSSNKDALRFDTHLGFQVEHTVKNAHPLGDIVILTMTREQCKYLEKGNPLEFKTM